MSTDDLRDRITGLPPERAQQELLDLVLRATRPMLENPLVRAEDKFADLGLGSLAAVELHRTLSTATGLELPLAMAFDYPTPQAVAGFLAGLLFGASDEPVFAPVGLSDDPIVLVGMGCRFPGDVRSPEDLWRLVLAETDAIGEFPTDRGWTESFSEDPDEPVTSYVRNGGFLADAAGFDADFFGISPREAEAMDPQQRLLLEVSWEAVERARINPRSLAGTRTGVFVGMEDHEYGPRLVDARDGAESHLITGNAASVGSGRIAYTLGLNGPALTVDTACSGSLVALHLAAQSLARGECDLALAGGVAVMATTGGFLAFSRQRGLAVDGRCKAFGAEADHLPQHPQHRHPAPRSAGRPAHRADVLLRRSTSGPGPVRQLPGLRRAPTAGQLRQHRTGQRLLRQPREPARDRPGGARAGRADHRRRGPEPAGHRGGGDLS